MENMSGVGNRVFILPKPSPSGSAKKISVLGDKNGRSTAPGSSTKKTIGKTPPLKPPKKHRSPDDDTEILRCKRRISFAGKMAGIPMVRNPKQMQKRNERERNRVRTINSTFETLQAYLPPGYIEPKPKNKKMSKVEVLKATIEYINNLQDVISRSDVAMHHQAHMHQHQQQMQRLAVGPSHNPNNLMMVSTAMSNQQAPGHSMVDMLTQHSPQVVNHGTGTTTLELPQLQTPPEMYPGSTAPGSMPPHSVPSGPPYFESSFVNGHPPQSVAPSQLTPVGIDTTSPNSSYNSNMSDGSYMEQAGPLTPEEEIIMEWVLDQRS